MGYARISELQEFHEFSGDPAEQRRNKVRDSDELQHIACNKTHHRCISQGQQGQAKPSHRKVVQVSLATMPGKGARQHLLQKLEATRKDSRILRLKLAGAAGALATAWL
eukprot:TRINITY_DN6513_c0_g1_i2.p1 TRINITY_DN6513_c0_g1~~TRINITY_DN6513_c0_g1_i2.p1  ORF type:complete len:109 (-),score=0.46 TRINITY_DN6513_c0_g1_i2:583-909(-)